MGYKSVLTYPTTPLKTYTKLLIPLILLPLGASAQVAINPTGADPDANAMLDVSSSSRGILFPRLTTVQMMEMAMPTGPSAGMIVFNTTANKLYFFSGVSWQPVASTPPDGDSDDTNEIQALSKSGTTVTLSNGGGAVDIADGDGSPTNEIQTISQSGNTVTLSNSGGAFSVADSDNDAANEIQALSKSGTTVTLSNGGGAVDIADGDSSPTNEIQALSKSGTTVTLSNSGGSVDIADGDSDPANEIQNLGLTQSGTDRTLGITGGTGASFSVADNDNDSTNELDSKWNVSGTDIYKNNSGNVGIGTTTPGEKLSLAGDMQIIQSSSTAGRAGAQSLGVAGSEIRALDFYYPGFDTTFAKISATNYNIDGTGWYTSDANRVDAGLSFFVSNNAVLSEAVTLNNAGNLGIKTTAPSRALDVNGSVRIRGGSPAAGKVLTATDSNGNASWQAQSNSITSASNFNGTEQSVSGSGAGWTDLSTTTDAQLNGVTSGQSFLVMASFRCSLKGNGSGTDDFAFRIGADNGGSKTFTANSQFTGPITMIDNHRSDWVPISFQRVMTINHTGNIQFTVQVDQDNADDTLYVDEVQITVIKL